MTVTVVVDVVGFVSAVGGGCLFLFSANSAVKFDTLFITYF